MRQENMYNPYQGRCCFIPGSVYFNANENSVLAAPFGRPPDFGGYPGGPPGAGKSIYKSQPLTLLSLIDTLSSMLT